MCPDINNIASLLNCGTIFIKGSIVPLVFALGAVMFVWGVINFFIIGAGEEAKRTQGKQFMIWGLVALAAVSSVWGLVRILGETFQLNTSVLPGIQYNDTPFKLKPTKPTSTTTNPTNPNTTTPFPEAGNQCRVDADCVVFPDDSGEVIMCKGGWCVKPL